MGYTEQGTRLREVEGQDQVISVRMRDESPVGSKTLDRKTLEPLYHDIRRVFFQFL